MGLCENFDWEEFWETLLEGLAGTLGDLKNALETALQFAETYKTIVEANQAEAQRMEEAGLPDPYGEDSGWHTWGVPERQGEE